MAGNFNLKVITPTRMPYDGTCEIVVLPGMEGEFAVMRDHMPLVAALAHGIMTIKTNGEEKIASVLGGFVEVINNQVTVTAANFEWPDEIDKNRAQAALERAERNKREAKSEFELKRIELAIRRANVRLELSTYSATSSRHGR